MPFPLITLLTDFGNADYFVGAMKGAILTVNPQAQIIDITHEIPAHDTLAGAFTLLAAYESFPRQTIHVAVVDPGVGSRRRPILVASDRYFFIGPDNGIFSYVCERERAARVFHLTDERFFHHPMSATFHGRDLFAPIAGALSNGLEPAQFGPEIADYTRLERLAPKHLGEGKLEASVIHMDRFGNCVTNITQADLNNEMIERGAHLVVGGREIKSFKKFFAEDTRETEEVFAVWGSAGFLELVAFKSSAARLLDIKRGERVLVFTA